MPHSEYLQSKISKCIGKLYNSNGHKRFAKPVFDLRKLQFTKNITVGELKSPE